MKYLTGCVLFLLSFVATAATTVVVKPLSELLLTAQQSAPAQVVNEQHATVSARLTATVSSLAFAVGDRVEKGQPLLSLECQDYDLAQRQAQSALSALHAQVRLARQQLSRAERLLKQKNASRELRDQRRAELDSLLAQTKGAEAQLAAAKLSVERCHPKAPFTGVITQRYISEGDLVSPGTQLLKLLSENQQEVKAELTVVQLDSLGNSASIAFQFQEQRYPLQTRAVIPLIENRARTQEVRLQFSADKALSGSSGRLLWQELAGRLPVKYVVSRNGQLGYMQMTDDKVRFIPLPQAIEGQAARVEADPQLWVIIEGQHSVNDGDDVIVADQN